MELLLPSASCVEHVLGTIEALACRFNSSGSDFVDNLDVHTLEEQAAVISTILVSVKAACSESPRPVVATATHIPSKWNTWLTTSASARPSSLAGRRSGRRGPAVVPGSNSVWWHEGTQCGS